MNASRLCCLALLCATVGGAAESVPAPAAAVAWTVVRGEREPGAVLQSKGGTGSLQMAAPRVLSLPHEFSLRFRTAPGEALSVTVTTADAPPKTPPLLQVGFVLSSATSAQISARGNGEPLATTTVSDRTWTIRDKKGGSVTYSWRFPRVKNLWDERDRCEIGAAYAALVPFDEKIFTLRLLLTAATRQIWLDDRLVAEDRTPCEGKVKLGLQLDKGMQVLTTQTRDPSLDGVGVHAFLPLVLDAYSHARAAQEVTAGSMLTFTVFSTRLGPIRLATSDLVLPPMYFPRASFPDLDLGQSLYRYRLTHGSGPDAGYVNALVAWPSPFQVDPASFTFRVPYRNYQNVWLLAWVDDKPNTVPRGNLQFYREQAGYTARTAFEITDAAIKSGLVTKTRQTTAAGKPLYVVKVPVDTAGLYGFRDLADQFLDFELTKPVALGRSYPDPIYYGYHPGGWPSSVHVVGITLEEAPFGFEVRPARTAHVFERPQQPAYTVAVSNTTATRLPVRVTLKTRSYDGTEVGGDSGRATIPANGTGTVELAFKLKTLGWHEVRVEVSAGDVARACTLALVTLPPNTRTYGNAPNETRFGTWNLLGHYVSFVPPPASPENEAQLALLRTLGLRRFPPHPSFVNTAMLKRHDFLPTGPHTVGNAFGDTVLPDGSVNREAMAKAVASEVADVPAEFADSSYFYGGEWHISREVQYAPWPRYTGDGDRDLNDEEKKNAGRHVTIFSAIGQGIREKHPAAKLILQWGAPTGTIAYLRAGMPKELVDMFGMDAPQFELLPEVSNVTGSINQLWSLRQEVARLGWPQLPIAWCEGPFFPTNPGALSETEQAEYQIRYWLLGLAYGVEQFQAGIVPHDAGNYYGAEHYGAGLFHRRPLGHPKPAVAAVATATAMLCGAAVVGPVDTGCPTTYCLAFQRTRDKAHIYALWRVVGTTDATIKLRSPQATVTDAMGNATTRKVKDGALTVTVSPSPVWLTGVEAIEGITLGTPRYTEKPAAITRALPGLTADAWTYDGAEDKAYAHNHFAIRRITDPNLKAEFGQAEKDFPDAVAITLPVEPGDRPLATRYGTLKLKTPATIPGKAAALGLWVKGNSSWGRVVYQVRDAKGETWTSVGTKDDWNCDDTHAWSYVSFEGWRYVRFPLPGNQPWDAARDLEITWWGHHGGDGIVDLPLALEKIIVETRNEVPVLGEMKLVPERSYKLAGLVAEYATEADTSAQPVIANQLRQPLPEWNGSADNPIARLAAAGTAAAPPIKAFSEPQHFNDGRSMHIRFEANSALKYNLYLARYADGRGAELLRAGVTDNQLVGGLRPEVTMYLFLTAVGADKKESKPSPPFTLVTHDNFAEK